ncbi:hypothetical protein [Flavobacterium sp.]|uniref:hypothetical protein n=1 Tax=Flavobacterium sp. TaxID=239 RepID=UPI0025D2FB4B|nr:hypothetical protein [Flavobacterium sp.]
MNYLKFTQYAYLIAAGLFAFEAFTQYQAGENGKAGMMGLFTFVGLFMFFFRRNYAKKFAERNKKP